MGTKYCPEAPRQKMISLMYLVLTAMLALNVDKSVLDAFAMVNHSFVETIDMSVSKNQRIYSDFDNAAKENAKKSGALNDLAKKVKFSSDSLYNYINSLKEMIVKKADGPKGNIDSIVSASDLNTSAQLMINQKHGTLLKDAIARYRRLMISMIDTSNVTAINSINNNLATTDPPVKDGRTPTWENEHFEGYPLIAVITLMSKMQSDVRDTESDVINILYTKIDAASYKFNKLQAQVVSTSDYILQGNTYEAKVFLSAVDTTISPNITIGGSTLPMVPGENAGLYKVTAGKEGKMTYTGQINYKNPSGVVVSYPFKHEYEVAKPSMSVSPTKMNVFYAGLANPVSISAPGISAKDLKVSVTNATIESTGPGTYVVRPQKVGTKAVVSVSATIDGKVKEIGSMDFRVKKVPDPVASVANKIDGSISKRELEAQQGVVAAIPDFDFEMKFTVLSFVISTSKGGFVVDKPTKGNRFSQEQRDLMKGLNQGSRLYFESIVVHGDDGTTRNLPAISFKITN